MVVRGFISSSVSLNPYSRFATVTCLSACLGGVSLTSAQITQGTVTANFEPVASGLTAPLSLCVGVPVWSGNRPYGKCQINGGL